MIPFKKIVLLKKANIQSTEQALRIRRVIYYKMEISCVESFSKF